MVSIREEKNEPSSHSQTTDLKLDPKLEVRLYKNHSTKSMRHMKDCLILS